LILTDMPVTPFFLILLYFGIWFSMSTGRGVSAQAMVSQVVKSEHRGSFQSFNSSMQQLGSGLAALVSGFIVVKGENGEIEHYNWVGYLSIAVLLTSLFIGRRIFKNIDK
jgi:MFS transporter, DHA1 family, inner membrane transport protein